jgi:hypothetical protein
VAAKPRSEWSPRYRQRIESAERKGLSRSQARGHAKPTERPASAITGTQLRGAAKREHEEKVRRGVPAVRWSTPTSAGTRDVQTPTADRAYRAILEAANAGKDILVGVQSDELELPEYRRRRKAAEVGWGFSGRIPADYMLAAIADHGGDVDAAIREVLAEQEIEVGKIDAYQVKEFSS